MALADIQDFAAAVKKLTSASKATGPKTEKGKLRSATPLPCPLGSLWAGTQQPWGPSN